MGGEQPKPGNTCLASTVARPQWRKPASMLGPRREGFWGRRSVQVFMRRLNRGRRGAAPPGLQQAAAALMAAADATRNTVIHS